MKKHPRVDTIINTLLTTLPHGVRQTGGFVSGLTARELAAIAGGMRSDIPFDPRCTTFCYVYGHPIADDCDTDEYTA
jgi:hypothetical protein